MLGNAHPTLEGLGKTTSSLTGLRVWLKQNACLPMWKEFSFSILRTTGPCAQAENLDQELF